MVGARPIKALVVDDAAFMRKQLVEVLSRSGEIEVVAVARHGLEALEAIKTLKPDVITLDVDMPVMDGLTTIKHIMVKSPVPVVMVSGLADQGKITFDALRLGAIDFFPKPSGTISRDIKDKAGELIRTLRLAANANPKAIKRAISHMKREKKDALEQKDIRGVVVVLARQGAVSSFIRMLCALDGLKGVGFICVQDISPTVLSAYCRELENLFNCISFGGEDVYLKAGSCILASEASLPQVTQDQKGFRFESCENSIDLPEFFNSLADSLRDNMCVVVLGGEVPKEAAFLSNVMSSGGEIIALDPEKCACSDLSSFVVKKAKGQVASSEVDLWEKIRAFSRRLYLQNVKEAQKQVNNP